MQSVILFILTQVAKLLTSAKFVDTVHAIVVTYANTDLSGEEKRQKALDAIKDAQKNLNDSVREYAPHLVNLVLEIIVAKIKAAQRRLDS